MGSRITNKDMAHALTFLADALRDMGWTPKPGYHMSWGAPYGQVVMYVYTFNPATRDYRHDVPGFLGSGGSGFVSKRAGYDLIMQTARALSDLHYSQEDRERFAV